MRCGDGLAARNPMREAPGGSINVSIRKRRPAMGTPPARARWRASCGPPADAAAISTIHYANPPPVHLYEGTPALRHPYVASSKSTCHDTRFPLATPPPRTRPPITRHTPPNSVSRPQTLVAHGSARGWPGSCLCQIARHRHRRLERGAASSQQKAKRNGISNSKHRIEKKGSRQMPANYTLTSPAWDSTLRDTARCVSREFLRAGDGSQGCWPFHACAICAPPT